MMIISVLIFGAIVLIVHELGHIFVWLLYGIKPKKVIVNGWRIGILFNMQEKYLDREQKFWGTLGGPLANATLAIAVMPFSNTLSTMSAIFGAANLLPIKGSDGRRIADLWKI